MKGANRSFASALRGPVITITIGVLFLLDNITGLKFSKTWPIILITLGAMALAGGTKRGRADETYPSGNAYSGEPEYPAQYPPPPPPGTPVPPGVRR